jgi:hypothetical protein
MGLEASLDDFSSRPCPDARYKLMICEQPVVGLSPITLFYDATRGQLCSRVASKLYFGLELVFPRVISLNRDQHKVLYETREFPTAGIFQEIKTRLQKATIPCRIRSPSREHRTPIRICRELRERLKRHPGLIAARLEIV